MFPIKYFKVNSQGTADGAIKSRRKRESEQYLSDSPINPNEPLVNQTI